MLYYIIMDAFLCIAGLFTLWMLINFCKGLLLIKRLQCINNNFDVHPIFIETKFIEAKPTSNAL